MSSSRWKNKTTVDLHIFGTNHQVNVSELKLMQEMGQKWKIELYGAIHTTATWNLLC